MSVLNQICIAKKAHIESRKQQVSEPALELLIADAAMPRGFIKNLRQVSKSGTALIAEVKKASPSKGVIREDFDPVQIAKIYEVSGAACLSVLTDEPYFQGKDAYLQEIRAAVDLPLLRKDFMLDPYQIIESRALGADCILLIMAALSDQQAKELYSTAKDLDLDVLVEVHDEDELNRALALKPEMIGVNNRNLKTLEVDIQTGFDLAKKIPGDIFAVAESGIDSPVTIESFRQSGYGAFLVGESLMRQDDISKAVCTLLGKNQ